MNGWKTKRIGDVCVLATGGTPSRLKPEYFGGNIRWLVSGDIHQGEIHDCEGRISAAGMKNSNAKLLPSDSVMIALNGQGKTRGTVALLRVPATCNQSMVCMTPKSRTELIPEFLYANLHGRYEEIRRMTSDDNNDRRGLNMGLISSIEVPIPPLAEQQRIVGVLNDALAGLATATANTENNLQNVRALFESHLQSIFTKRGKAWVERKLGDLAEFKNGLNFTRQSKGQTLQIVGVGDFQDNAVVPTDALQTVTIDGKLSDDYLIRRDDILTVRSNGSRDLVGRCMIVPEVNRMISYSGFVIRIRFDTRDICPRFLLRFLKSSETRERLTGDGGGANISNINQAKLSELPIFLPSFREQENIAAKLDALATETQRLESHYKQKQAAMAALKQSLLHNAFSGHL